MKASELNDDDLKMLKKQLKLPIKKSLVYYDIDLNQHNIVDFEIIKELSECKILKIYLQNGTTKSILSDYFEEMQKSNFIKSIAE